MREDWLSFWINRFGYAYMNIEVIFKIAAIGFLIAVICQVLKKTDRDDIATMVSIAGLIIVLTVIVGMVSDLFDTIRNMFYLY